MNYERYRVKLTDREGAGEAEMIVTRQLLKESLEVRLGGRVQTATAMILQLHVEEAKELLEKCPDQKELLTGVAENMARFICPNKKLGNKGVFEVTKFEKKLKAVQPEDSQMVRTDQMVEIGCLLYFKVEDMPKSKAMKRILGE